MSELKDVPISKLMEHPDNPRLQMRDDVVDRLAAEIERVGFGREHALLVRPLASGYQIVSGHHRTVAAERAGLDEVPCWVREMDDDEAFMLLVLSNTQGELSPLEIGMHARTWRGQQQDYAARTGFGKSYISRVRTAADVASVSSTKLGDLDERSMHLYEVSRAPRDAWPLLVDALVAHGWSVPEVAKHVEQVKAFEVPDRYADWLPIGDVVARYLDAPDRFTPRTVTRLVTVADETAEWISSNVPDEVDAFHRWLVEQRPESWDHRAVVAYQQRLLAERWEVKGWRHGDWRDHIDDLDDGSVALLLTDPPYGMGYQSGYRVEAHASITSDATVDEAAQETLAAVEALVPKLADDAHALVFCTWRNELEVRQLLTDAGLEVRGSLVWAKNATSMGNLDGTFAPKHERIVHAVKGNPRLYRRAPDVLEVPRESSERHPTEKPVKLLAELIEATTATGEVVADPFAGVASTCVAAKDTSRKWWGCELDDSYARIGEERLT